MSRKILILLLSYSMVTGCTYNPFITNNHISGNPVVAGFGAGLGAGGVALLTSSKALMATGGLAGAAIGYYATTLRYASGGIMQGGGKVYKIGDYLGIYIPTDNLFQPNTAEFLPKAPPILDSAAMVLKRYHNRSIMISGNTSGFYMARWERELSEKRAQRVSAYLWSVGIRQSNTCYKFNRLTYVGHGDYFPLEKTFTNRGLRENSRIQITSYPSDCDIMKGSLVQVHEVRPQAELPLAKPPVMAALAKPAGDPIRLAAKAEVRKPRLNLDSPFPATLDSCDTMDSEGKCLDELIRQRSKLKKI